MGLPLPIACAANASGDRFPLWPIPGIAGCAMPSSGLRYGREQHATIGACSMERLESTMRLMGMSCRGAIVGTAVAVVLLVAGCSSQATGPTAASVTKATPAVGRASIDSAQQVCQAAAGPGVTVVVAHETTVARVRAIIVGPFGSSALAGKRWSGLPAQGEASWCALHVGTQYSIVAATPNRPMISFVVSSSPLTVGPGGPATL